jgi:tRNA A-37 threonylcarbamoyl transferase component Bud32
MIGDRTVIAQGATADVLVWDDGRVLKLFYERSPFHENELIASRAAAAADLPVPTVSNGLIELDEREGIVFERIDGPTLDRYLEAQPDRAVICGRELAELHARIHAEEVQQILSYRDINRWAVGNAEHLPASTRDRIFGLLDRLPDGKALCHGDFHPNNVIKAPHGLVAIDWAVGSRCNPLADVARSWFISRMDLFVFSEAQPEADQGHVFWTTYLDHYRDLHPFSDDEFNGWQVVSAAASLSLDGRLHARASVRAQLLDFVHAALQGNPHAWTN